MAGTSYPRDYNMSWSFDGHDYVMDVDDVEEVKFTEDRDSISVQVEDNYIFRGCSYRVHIIGEFLLRVITLLGVQVYSNGQIYVPGEETHFQIVTCAVAEGVLTAPLRLYQYAVALGHGAFGSVYPGFYGRNVAVKRISNKWESEYKAINILYETLPKGTSLHVNMMVVYETMMVKTGLLPRLYVVMEILPNEIHEEYAHNLYPFIDVLDYLKSRGLCHLDIKPDNIRGKNGLFKLCDYGTVRAPGKFASIGTPNYMYPVSVRSGMYDNTSDDWSLMMTYVILCRGNIYQHLPNGFAIMMDTVNQTTKFEVDEDNTTIESAAFVIWAKEVRERYRP